MPCGLSGSRDAPDAFFYLDPPYAGADQGHYGGYAQEGFDALLGLLEGIKGKFPLSSYRNKALADCTRRNGRVQNGFAYDARPRPGCTGQSGGLDGQLPGFGQTGQPGQKGRQGAGKSGLRRLATATFTGFEGGLKRG
jgi:hypothetical protein